MTDQPVVQGTPPATASPDMMVKVKVDRTEFTEPLSKVVTAYQTQAAAEKRLTEANALLTSRKAQVDFAERFLQNAERNPVAALEELRNQMQMRLGRPIRLPGETAGADDGAGGGFGDPGREPDAQTRRLEAQIAELSQHVRQMQTATTVSTGEAEIAKELDRYPTFKGQDEASQRMRASIALAVAGLKNANPQANTSDLVSELHAGLSGLMSTQATNDQIGRAHV